ncbi:hypothetical protein [Pseudomonas asiatica]|uniref:hypothetical protein n=1 Tax=Pseudomonas asiatica TaxID=2219225 RepID=UPI0010BFC7C3|nr:hypothetical protein [Pseudomonas asiatica]
MVTYFRRMYVASRDVTASVRITLIVLFSLPSLILTPLLLHVSRLADGAAAKVEMFFIAKRSVSEEQKVELLKLAERVFTHNDGLWPLTCTILVIAFICSFCATFMLLPGIIAGVQRVFLYKR